MSVSINQMTASQGTLDTLIVIVQLKLAHFLPDPPVFKTLRLQESGYGIFGIIMLGKKSKRNDNKKSQGP